MLVRNVCFFRYIQNIFNVLINSGHIHTRFKPPLRPPKRNTHELLKQYGKQIGIYYAIFLVVATTKQHHKVFANFSLHKLYLNQGKKVSHQCKKKNANTSKIQITSAKMPKRNYI